MVEKKKKKSQKLNKFYFIVLIKSATTAEGGKKGKGQKNKRNYRTSQNIGMVNAFLESLSKRLAGSHSPPRLPGRPSNTVLVSGPAVGTAQTLIGSYSCVFLPPMSTLSELVLFLCVCGSTQCPFVYSIDAESAWLTTWI